MEDIFSPKAFFFLEDECFCIEGHKCTGFRLKTCTVDLINLSHS